MRGSCRIDIAPHDLTAIIDAFGCGLRDTLRVIDRGEVPALVPQVAVDDEVEAAGELAAIVEVKDHGDAEGISGVDGREGVVVHQETVDQSLGIDVVARNLTGVIDAARARSARHQGQRSA